MTNILKQKTTWVGVLTIGYGLIEGIFDGNWSAAGTKILLGIGMITGRQAIAKLQGVDCP